MSNSLPQESIIGIAIGSVIVAILLGILLFFLLRSHNIPEQRKNHVMRQEDPETRSKYTGAVTLFTGQYGRAELPDAEYIRMIERLHEGAKPELEGSKGRRSIWQFFSIRSANRSGPLAPQVPTELGTKPPTPGPYELAGGDVLQWNNQSIETSRTLRRVHLYPRGEPVISTGSVANPPT
jgi:hypothetical protein